MRHGVVSLRITWDILEPHFSAIRGHLASYSLEETVSALAGSNARRVHFLGLELKKIKRRWKPRGRYRLRPHALFSVLRSR